MFLLREGVSVGALLPVRHLSLLPLVGPWMSRLSVLGGGWLRIGLDLGLWLLGLFGLAVLG